MTLSAQFNVVDRLVSALLQTRSDAILATKSGRNTQFWYPGAECIFGFDAATEAVGRSLDMIIPEGPRSQHWAGRTHVIDTGESRYGVGELLSVRAMNATGRRISVEFPILRDVDGESELTLRDVMPCFGGMNSLRRQLGV
jgi:hypothetical protein